MSILSLQRIAQLAGTGELATRYAGLVDIREYPGGGLILLNYTRECQFRGAWDNITVLCRGLVLDTSSWTVAALPFVKFSNLGERLESSVEALPREPLTVFEKLDGSLEISYLWRGELDLTRLGSMTWFCSGGKAFTSCTLLRKLATAICSSVTPSGRQTGGPPKRTRSRRLSR